MRIQLDYKISPTSRKKHVSISMTDHHMAIPKTGAPIYTCVSFFSSSPCMCWHTLGLLWDCHMILISNFCVFLSELLFCPLMHKLCFEPFLCIYIALASTSILRFEHSSCKINPNANMGFEWPQVEVPTKGFSKITRERSSMLKSTLVDGPL